MPNQHKKILVIEDEVALSLSLKDNLITEGFDVILAKDGEEGVALALREKPDLILLDILMPTMDGMIMMKKLRENEWGKKVKIIVLTNVQADDAIIRGITRDEPTYYFVKADWHISALLEKIEEVFDVTQ